MRLIKLLKKLNLKNDNYIDHNITLISEHTKDIINNSIFFAIEGNDNGLNYIDEAIKKGAKTIISEVFICNKNKNINYIQVDNTRKYLTIFLNTFYKNITKKIKLIGITGTNGKTTIATLTTSFLEYMGKKVMNIGTDGIYFNQKQYETVNTTPSPTYILKIINEAYKKKLKYVIMEVSSHAIKQLRVFGFDFDIVLFNNLGHDHLDYHKTIIDYRYTKGIFLASIDKNKTVILNKDDDSYPLYYSFIKSNIKTYSINNFSDFYVTKINENEKNLSFEFKYTDKIYNVKSYLIGRFNIYNILASIAIINDLKFKIEDYIIFLKIFNKVEGRMEIINYYNRKILIDFAHTVNGVKSVLETVKKFNYNKLTVVIGLGGNRDKEKRSLIGKIVCNYANNVIFTTDNPRNENPIDIINDITKNLNFNNYKVIINRQKAIVYAIKNSIKDELIIILGKGNEKYQIINDIKYPYNDLDFIKKLKNKVVFYD